MPLFFFHYHTPETSTYDDTGCDFETLELAYLDAYRSAIDLGAEILKAQGNPASHIMEIAGHDGRVLTELRFDEIFRPERMSTTEFRRSFDAHKQAFRERMATFHSLRDSMVEACIVARENVAKAHEVLRRARAV